jgi:hypothetical protein
MKHILDTGFKYRPAVDTDVRKTFDRVRKEQRQQKAAADCAPWFDDSAFSKPKALVRQLTTARST